MDGRLAHPAQLKTLGGPVEQALGDLFVEGRDADRELTTGERLPVFLGEALVLGNLSHRADTPRTRTLPAILLVLAVLLVDQLLVEGQALVMERVAQLLALGVQIRLVVRVRDGPDRYLIGDREPVSLQAEDLLRVVGEDPDARQTEVDEDLGADPVVAQVGGQAELQVGVNRVEALLLELVGAELVEQADPATLLGEVEQDALPLPLDRRQRRLELLAAVAAQRVEDVAGEALRSGPGPGRPRRRRPRP